MFPVKSAMLHTRDGLSEVTEGSEVSERGHTLLRMLCNELEGEHETFPIPGAVSFCFFSVGEKYLDWSSVGHISSHTAEHLMFFSIMIPIAAIETLPAHIVLVTACSNSRFHEDYLMSLTLQVQKMGKESALQRSKSMKREKKGDKKSSTL